MTPNPSGGLVNGAEFQGTGHDERSGPDMTAGMESVTNPRDSPFKTCDSCAERSSSRIALETVWYYLVGLAVGPVCDGVGHGSVRHF